MNMGEPLSYVWLNENGFHTLDRRERQPTDHCRRCIGGELVEDSVHLVAREDLCLDVAPERWPNPNFWFCWVTRCSSQNNHPSIWLHVRHLRTVGDLVLLYEGLTGRQFGQPHWKRSNLMPAINMEKRQ